MEHIQQHKQLDQQRIYSTIDSLGSKMISTGSSDSRLINGNNSSIRVGNKLGVQVEGTSITSISNSNWGSSNSRGYSNGWGSGNKGCSSSISSSLGSKMVSTGSSNCWLIKRNNSSIGMGNELSVKVKWSSISITSSISCSIGISSISSNSRGSSNSRSSNWCSSNNWSSSTIY